MGTPFLDSLGRTVTYLRVSVTDRCDMRCVYCMSETMSFLPKAEILTYAELERLCAAFIRSGVTRLRVTGGEPLVRRDVGDFFQAMGKWLHRPGGNGHLDELTVTTNGSRLAEHAGMLAGAGVRRVNISLDSLDSEKFRRITRRGNLDQTLAGVRAARLAGLAIRINTVAMAGVNDDEFDTLLAWCGEIGADLCLIETMPMGETGEDRTDRYLPLSAVRTELSRRWTLEPLAERTGGPACYLRVRETGRKLGLITPMTHNFCESCNRVRLSCTGQLYPCLGDEGATDLRHPLREGASDAELLHLVQSAILRKPKGHDFVIGRRADDPAAMRRHMSVTGG
ncbi:cyclic pyranopterin monophosphate synthase [Gluconacetobacter liquefaciens]|uniref:GTP 3',8-cyclase n=1 Tax=Gluconacetobacter liquefaciens TaxID=89584 RepID=A0A370FYH1_GLULI|nr:GTP 3',8-cyclase MoaA [Gluconacetobacter liquefaciens]MBB2187642.1 GTP 3',8-cyclase MoaA [Gluconacetobacter liquefaciens]RDI36538.1 cyclic pyranopterin phosphate synthase [Gluconacetobacter liquefaciens]GBR02500.1 molybdenum cofactor biosynthesis protein A [Gluconacetobacter liquefaciens NRIC 0522]GEB37489.1 cyclic pyranopterin monophosphate synthase [Gluconacetobacter liquefaciens]